MKLSTHDLTMIAVGGGLVFALAYYARSNAGDVIVPEVQTEAQFSGLGLALGGAINAGTNLSLDPQVHFYHPGYDPEPTAQKLRTLPIRYPIVSGGNVTTVMHRGWSAMCKGSPDNPWRVAPPSEATI